MCLKTGTGASKKSAAQPRERISIPKDIGTAKEMAFLVGWHVAQPIHTTKKEEEEVVANGSIQTRQSKGMQLMPRSQPKNTQTQAQTQAQT